MKKTAVFLFILMILTPAFAQKGYNWKVKGYYGSGVAGNTKLLLDIKDYTNSYVLNGYELELTEKYATTGLQTFSWEMDGNYNVPVMLSFELSVMQAELDGEYYRPAYKVSFALDALKKSDLNITGYSNTATISKKTCSLTELLSITTQTDSKVTTGSGWSGTTFSYTKSSSSTKFTGGNKITYTLGNITKYRGHFSNGSYYGATEGDADGTNLVCDWIRRGSCTLQITGYYTENEVPAGIYNYTTNVTVTFATN